MSNLSRSSSSLNVGDAAIASGLVGFAATSLRVRITRMDGRYVWVTTADLLDVGTPLTLDAAQVAPLDETTAHAMYAHRNALVTMDVRAADPRCGVDELAARLAARGLAVPALDAEPNDDPIR